MGKTMHQVSLFLEKQEESYRTPLKIGNLFFNRFGTDEDAAFESVGVYHLQKSSREMELDGNKEKGMDINHIYVRNHFITSIIG